MTNPPSALITFILLVLLISAFLAPGVVKQQRRRRALADGGSQHSPLPRSSQQQPAQQETKPMPTTPPPPTPPERAPIWTFTQTLSALGTRPHIGIAAESQAGKSTLAAALLNLRVRAGHKVVVINPHQRPADYGGIPQHRTYEHISAAMLQLLALLDERKEAAASGDENYHPITIVIEEAPALASRLPSADGKLSTANVPIAPKFFATMLQEAAKYKMFIILLTQSTQVKALGIEGNSSILENLIWVALGERAVAENPAAADQPRPAVLLTRRQSFLCDIAHAADIASRPLSADVVQRFAVPAVAAVPVSRSEPAELASENQTTEPAADIISDLIRIIAMVSAGKTGNEIIDALGGNRSARLKQIAAVRLQLKEQE